MNFGKGVDRIANIICAIGIFNGFCNTIEGNFKEPSFHQALLGACLLKAMLWVTIKLFRYVIDGFKGKEEA